MDRLGFDGLLVIGGGLAGLSAALAAADEGRKVLVVCAEPLGSGCSSAWAQGGMAAALSPDDDPALHAADTIAAGGGLVDPSMAALLADEGPRAVRRLAALGAPFDRDTQGRFVQSLEAAHSRARVARIGGDGAGGAIMAAVIAAVRANSLITVLDQSQGLSLLQDRSGAVGGAVVATDARVTQISAAATLLATGGLGGLYAVTTNPTQVRGLGLALAALAGAEIGDPEFVQFHPTAINIPQDPAPLATEALRGEGARLVDGAGQPFMPRYDARGDLAPRDVVARAIHQQIQSGLGAALDAREAVGAHFPAHFPAVFEACMAAGIDPRVQVIPVAPAAHYHMGGVVTDAHGQTTLPGLYAAGECASTGVHGANRLASNSLLEAAVFGTRAGRAAAGAMTRKSLARPLAVSPSLPHAPLQSLRAAMSRHAGVMRSETGLTQLFDTIEALRRRHGPAGELTAADLVCASALARRESRGGHFREDFQQTDAPKRTLLNPREASASSIRVAAA